MGRLIRAEFVPLDGRRFVTLDYDATDPENPGVIEEILVGDFAARDLVADAIVRFRYAATRDQARRIDNTAIRQALLDAGAYAVAIQPEIVREQTARVAGLTESLSELDALDVYLAQYPGLEGPIADTMRARTRRYLEAVS